MWHLLLLLAEGETKTPAPVAGPDPILSFLPIALIVLMIFMWQSKRRKDQDRQAVLTGLKKNDKVITTAGIYGVVVGISDTEDEITVKVDDNVRIKMVRDSILRNLSNEEAAKAAQAKAKEQKSSTFAAKS
jgi:preprotein translocase subunit YajC